MIRVISTLASLFSTLFIFAWYRDFELYLIAVGSIAFHELGHTLALLLLGYEFDVRFSSFGAFVRWRKTKTKSISSFDSFIITFMGPFFTWVLIATAYVGIGFEFSTRVCGLFLVFNTIILLLNLLIPFKSDGYKLVVDTYDIFKAIAIKTGNGKRAETLSLTAFLFLAPLLIMVFKWLVSVISPIWPIMKEALFHIASLDPLVQHFGWLN